MKVQVRIPLPPEVRAEVDRLRLAYNPERAAGNPAHVTVAYQDEAQDQALLIERVARAAARVRRFRLAVGAAAGFPPPVVGAFLPVADPTGGVAALRDVVLAPPFTRRGRFGLHVTLLHPDQGMRLEEAWPAFLRLPSVGDFVVAELQVVGPDNAAFAVFPLGPDARPGGGRFGCCQPRRIQGGGLRGRPACDTAASCASLSVGFRVPRRANEPHDATTAVRDRGPVGTTSLVLGETTPSVAFVVVHGTRSRDGALDVEMGGDAGSPWCAADKLDFVDPPPGTEARIRHLG